MHYITHISGPSGEKHITFTHTFIAFGRYGNKLGTRDSTSFRRLVLPFNSGVYYLLTVAYPGHLDSTAPTGIIVSSDDSGSGADDIQTFWEALPLGLHTAPQLLLDRAYNIVEAMHVHMDSDYRDSYPELVALPAEELLWI